MIKYAQARQCRRVVHPRLLRRRAARRGSTAAAATTAGRRSRHLAAAAGRADRHARRPRGAPEGPLGGRPGQGAVRQDGGRADADRLGLGEDGPLGLKRLSTFGILDRRSGSRRWSRSSTPWTAPGCSKSPEVDRFRPIVNLTRARLGAAPRQGPVRLRLALPGDLLAKVRNGGLERLASRPAAEPRPSPAPHPDRGPGRVAAGRRRTARTRRSGGRPALASGSRRCRPEWAREAKQPAYCIFPTRPSRPLVRARPRTPQALAGIKGLGPARLERYGAALLEAIAECGRPDPAARDAPVPALGHPSPPGRGRRPPAPRIGRGSRTDPVGRSVRPDRGVDLAAPRSRVHARRGRGDPGARPPAVVRHVTLMARQGRPLALESFLTPDLIRALGRLARRARRRPSPFGTRGLGRPLGPVPGLPRPPDERPGTVLPRLPYNPDDRWPYSGPGADRMKCLIVYYLDGKWFGEEVDVETLGERHLPRDLPDRDPAIARGDRGVRRSRTATASNGGAKSRGAASPPESRAPDRRRPRPRGDRSSAVGCRYAPAAGSSKRSGSGCPRGPRRRHSASRRCRRRSRPRRRARALPAPARVAATSSTGNARWQTHRWLTAGSPGGRPMISSAMPASSARK